MIDWRERGQTLEMTTRENKTTLPDVYHPTVLGMICASPAIATDESARILLRELLQESPTQVAYSQVPLNGMLENDGHHTPLRDAILNPKCPLDVLQLLLQADQNISLRYTDYIPASYRKDSRGLLPLDHLMLRVQSSDRSVSMLETFLETRPALPPTTTKIEFKLSPITRLLSLVDPSIPILDGGNSAKEIRLNRIQEVIRCLLRHEPELLYLSSSAGCSPLHIAARTCGNFFPILRELLSADESNRLVAMENDYDDLPIHVVCSCGANLEVLENVASKTASFDRKLLWCTTGFGYTPADLLWLNHIEAGSSFGNVGRFHYGSYLFTSTQSPFDKDNEYYQKVLRNVVNDLTNGDVGEGGTTTVERMELATRKFGDFLERLFVLLSMSCSDGTEGTSVCSKYLHHACKVSTPYGRTLSLQIFKVLLWIHKDDLLTVDESGNLPLHHALGNNSLQRVSQQKNKSEKNEDEATTNWNEWTECCQDLMDAAPEACRMTNQHGQLPLHLLLSNRSPGSNCIAQKLYQRLINKMVEIFPESVQTRDPVSGLDPFMLAATVDGNLPLTTVYSMLRQCPNLCHRNDGALV